MVPKIPNGHKNNKWPWNIFNISIQNLPKCTKNDIIGMQKYRLATLVGRPP
jgi:hypothetical protein